MTADVGRSHVTLRTRSGRISKKPVRLEPTEDVCEDDYSDDDYDTDSDNKSDEDLCETETDTEDEISDSEADDNGNLKGFIVDDDNSDEKYEA